MRRQVFVVGIALGMAAPATVQPFDWNNPSDDSFATAGVQLPAGSPRSTGQARFHLPNAYTVTIGGTLALAGLAGVGCVAFSRQRWRPAVVALVLLAGYTSARAQTYVGPGLDWNTAANWGPATVPNSSSAAVSFAGAVAAGPVNISSSVQAQSITFSNTVGGYTITSGAGQTLSGISSISLTSAVTGTEIINLANVATGSLLFAVGGPLTITNNAQIQGASLIIGPNTVIGSPGSGAVIVTGFGTTQFTGTFASNASPNNQVIGGLTKNGPGTFLFSGSGPNLSGGLTLNDGTLVFDYSTILTSKLSTSVSSSLYLNGGQLQFTANSATPFTQSVPGGTSIVAGHTDVSATSGTGSVTFAAGSITHSVGGTVDFTPSSSGPTFAITTSAGNTNGLLGTGPAFATVNGASTWAINSGGTIAGLTAYGTNIYSAGTNTDVTASASFAGLTTNSLRFSGPGTTLTLSGTNTLQSGGILVPPSGFGVITGGTLSVPGAGELLVHDYGYLSLNSAVSGPGGLTKSGPGDLNLGGTNTSLTGPININRGSLIVTNTAAVNSASAINLNDGRSVSGSAYSYLQRFAVQLGDDVSGTITPAIRLAGTSPSGYATAFNTGDSAGSTITLSGAISSAPGLVTPIRFYGPFNLVQGDNSTGFNLTGTNTFTGNVSLYAGSLGVTSDASLGNPANTLSLEVNSTTAGGLIFLNGGINVARPIVISFPTRLISNGTDSNTISGPISGTGGIYKTGTGTLTLTNGFNTVTGPVTVAAGTLALTGQYSIDNLDVTVAAGATFQGAGNVFSNGFRSLTLNGGTYRVNSGTGMQIDINFITNAAGGTVDYTGAGSDQIFLYGPAGITINGSSTWLSPGNGTYIANGNFVDPVPITIPAGVTLNNGIALGAFFGSGFRVVGGGTLFQNSDATNVLAMSAPVTIVQSRFRITDASSNGGVGNLGTGPLTLDAGTLSYGGPTAISTKAISLTANGGAIVIESPAATLAINGAITGLGGLTVPGPGTLVLGSAANTFTSLTINGGAVQVANDAALGAGAVAVGPAGTLNFTATTSTSRTISLSSGTLAVSGGATLTLAGAAVYGGFVVGPGGYVVNGGTLLTGVTTFSSTSISQTGPGSFVNFSNGGPLTVGQGISPVNFTRFTNQGSASIMIGAAASVGATDFQTYGTLSVNPATVTENFSQTTLLTNMGQGQLYFNGGSRTFIGTPATAVFPSNWSDPNLRGFPTFVAGIDLHGQNAVVAGGLFVNNGYVEDSTNNGQGTAAIVADFGSLVKGAGYFQNSVQTINGGKFQAGNSPGKATFGGFVLGPGGVSNYVFAIDDATGTAGPSPDAAGHVSGWGLVKSIGHLTAQAGTPGDFTWTATPADKLTFTIQTLLNPTTVGVDVPGMMDDFDPSLPYKWPAVAWTGSYAGPTFAAMLDASTSFDLSGFANPVGGTFGWSLDAGGHTLALTYTPTAVPEPGTLTLTIATVSGFVLRRRRRS
jgi:autotransporter-associated beta strand protein